MDNFTLRTLIQAHLREPMIGLGYSKVKCTKTINITRDIIESLQLNDIDASDMIRHLKQIVTANKACYEEFRSISILLPGFRYAAMYVTNCTAGQLSRVIGSGSFTFDVVLKTFRHMLDVHVKSPNPDKDSIATIVQKRKTAGEWFCDLKGVLFTVALVWAFSAGFVICDFVNNVNEPQPQPVPIYTEDDITNLYPHAAPIMWGINRNFVVLNHSDGAGSVYLKKEGGYVLEETTTKMQLSNEFVKVLKSEICTAAYKDI